jgi:probable F420-dependent oxidoreductase
VALAAPSPIDQGLFTVNYAVYAPTFGEYAAAAVLASLAADAENCGWDGFFIWDHLAMWWDRSAPVVDTWVALSAIALTTSRVRIGALVTPLPRRRPHKLARETASLDRLCGGRLILGVGLGANEHEFEAFAETEGLATRAAMLDEGLQVLTGLWSGDDFRFHGDFYEVTGAQFQPTPLQRPRIPIWVAGSWPKRAPFRRAASWDGAICALAEPGEFNTPVEVVAAIRELARRQRGDDSPFDLIIVNGNPEWDNDIDAGQVARYAEAGLTWWLEDIGPWRFGGSAEPPWPLDDMRARILAGPPRF